jgi:Metal-dependent hydrolase
MPFIGLILPILLLANLASAIYWTIRWRCWVFIPLIAIFSNWGYMSCVLQSPFFSPASSPMVKMNVYTPGVLTVATYNVDAFNHEHTGYSCKEIASYMRNLQADILCFQEFGINDEFGIDSISAALSNWPYHYIPSSPEGKNLLQLAVFSRYPIKEEHLIIYPDSKNCSLACDIEINGRTIRLFNNHLQTTEVSQNKRKLEKGLRTDDSQRVEHAALGLIDGLHENFRKRAVQADLLKQLIAASPYPTLVCGDFNSLPSSYVYHTIKGDKLQDGFQRSGHGYMYTFKYFKHLLRIDYILHSPELNSTDYFSPDLNYSDHNPVVMRMK